MDLTEYSSLIDEILAFAEGMGFDRATLEGEVAA